jgi:hypothetical protein
MSYVKNMKKMKSLKERVFEISAEAMATGSIEGIYHTKKNDIEETWSLKNLMVEVYNSNEPNKLSLMKKIKHSFNLIIGKPVERNFTNFELSRSPYNTNDRPSCYWGRK